MNVPATQLKRPFSEAVSDDAPDSAPAAAGSHRKSLRILSYNIQAGIASDAYHHYLTNCWKHFLPSSDRCDNLDRIAELVSDYDMVGLQEVDGGSFRSGFVNQTEYLAGQGSFPHWHQHTNRNFGMFAKHGIGFLSRYKTTAIEGHKLPGLVPGRGALAVQFGEGKDAIIIVTVHLALNKHARLRQLAYISAVVADYEHVVLMGDLNCESDSREMRGLMACTSLHPPIHGLYTFPSWRPLRSLDHILVSPSLRVETVRVISTPCSDHLPIAMEISLPAVVSME